MSLTIIIRIIVITMTSCVTRPCVVTWCTHRHRVCGQRWWQGRPGHCSCRRRGHCRLRTRSPAAHCGRCGHQRRWQSAPFCPSPRQPASSSASQRSLVTSRRATISIKTCAISTRLCINKNNKIWYLYSATITLLRRFRMQ